MVVNTLRRGRQADAGLEWLSARGSARCVVRLIALVLASAGSLMATASGAEAPNCGKVVFSAPDFKSRPYLAGTNPFYTSTDQQCTWYVFGRVLERSGQSIEFSESTGRDAYRWPVVLASGYQRLQTPQAGAIAIWKHKTINDFGHVAYIEAVQGNSVAYTEANFSTYGKGGGYDGGMKCSLVETFEDNKGLTGKWEFVEYVLPERPEGAGGQEPQLIRLSPAEPSAEWSAVIEAPAYGVHTYKVFAIDLSSFPDGGVLTIDVRVAPDSETAGSFDIFPEGVRVPTEGRPDESVAGAYDIPPGEIARLEYRFDRGRTVSFGAEGNWFSRTGVKGRALVSATVTPNRTTTDEATSVRLSPSEPSAEWSTVIEAPEYWVNRYKVFAIDLSPFRNGGVLTIDVNVAPDSNTAGSFDIFPEGVRVPTEGRPDESVAGAYDIPPGEIARLEYRFDRGQTVSFGAEGNWFSPTGAQGRALVRASVVGVLGQESGGMEGPGGLAPPSAEWSGRVVSIRSVNYPTRFLRHRGFAGELTEVEAELDALDASFIVRSGLAGGDSVSFESVNYPDHFLRHYDYQLVLSQFEDADIFKNDASFAVRPGRAGTGSSLEAVNYPGYYIRHCGFRFFIDNNEYGNALCDPAVFLEDISFQFENGQSLVYQAGSPDGTPEVDPLGACGSSWLQRAGVPDYLFFESSVGIAGLRKPVDFGRACEAHDECYRSAGSQKSSCDSDFVVQLQTTCDETLTGGQWVLGRAKCRVAADGYFLAVRRLGCEAFKDAQRAAGAPDATCD